jgi:hypothetical protein
MGLKERKMRRLIGLLKASKRASSWPGRLGLRFACSQKAPGLLKFFTKTPAPMAIYFRCHSFHEERD